MGHFKALYLENNTLFGLGPSDATANILNIKPVWPLILDDWNLVNRLILPVIWMEGQDRDIPPEIRDLARQRGVAVGAGELSLDLEDAFGLGDFTYQAFVRVTGRANLSGESGRRLQCRPILTHDSVSTNGQVAWQVCC